MKISNSIINVKHVTLNDFGLPHVTLYENGVIYDRDLDLWKVPNPSNKYEFSLRRYGILDKRKTLSFNVLKRYYFQNLSLHSIRNSGIYKHLKFLGYPRYWVSHNGDVYSSKQVNILKQTTTWEGYKKVLLLNFKREPKTWAVHRLVALCFCKRPIHLASTPYYKLQVNHLNTHRDCNDFWNLEWCTNLENNRHARKVGRQRPGLSDEVVHSICKDLEVNIPTREIVNKYKVKPSQIHDMRRGTYAYITKKYKFRRSKHYKLKPMYNKENRLKKHRALNQ